jgi:hypothetical protein
MRYRLRTLLILLAVLPVALWVAWLLWVATNPNQSFFIPESIDIQDGRGPQPIEQKDF